MKKVRALTLLLAVSMLLSLFPVMTSAASDYNYIKIEEEVIVENGNFDKKPVIKNDQGRSYHTQTPGTWSYQYNTTGTAGVTYANDDGDGYLQVTAANVNPSVAYSFGTVGKGEYTLSLDVTPESSSNINGITVQIFWLDSNFAVGNTAYRLITESPSLTKGEKNTVSVPLSLSEDTNVAFRVYTYPDNPANGNYCIDNVSLARPTDILIETAVLDAVDVSKAYTGANDTTLPAGKWVATDDTYLNLSSDGNKIVASKKDSDIAFNPSIIYTFPETVDQGKYRLTFDVLTAESKEGGCQVANASSGWKDLGPTKSSEPITGGRRYTMVFDVENDNTLVAFRYWQPDSVIPSKPFSIDNVKLEFYTAESFDPNAISWEVVEQNDFTTAPSDLRSFTGWATGATSNIWALKTSSGAKPTHDAQNGRLVFANANQDGIIHKYYNANTALAVGDYRFVFDLNYDKNDGVDDYDVTTQMQAYIAQSDTLWSSTSKWPGVNTATGATIELPFTLTEPTNAVYFRAYPNSKDTKDKYPPTYYVDNYKLERKVVGAVIEGSWGTVYDSKTATAPTLKNDAGINNENAKDYKDTWTIRQNGGAVGAVKLDYANNRLNVTARDTAINGKHSVMYRFNNTLSKGSYSIEASLKTTCFTGELYKLTVCDLSGNEKASVEKWVGANQTADISIIFTLDADTDLVLCIQSNNSYKYMGAFEVSGVNVSKLSNPLVQLRSNADLATFDSDEGVYYMAVNAQRDIYLNYFANTDVRSGQYMLSAEFKTAADQNVQLFANFGTMDLDVNTIQAGDEWQHIEYPVTLKKDTALSISNGIRFKVNSTAPLYMRNLKLVFVENLPKPAINAAITMILLKKIEGTYAGHISTKPVEYAVNGGFDTEIKIDHEQSRAYLKHEDGRWSYSKNSGEVKASIVKDGASSYAYFEVANANPTVGHRIGTLPAGSYTLSFDIYPEYNIGNIRTRIFKLTDGFAVGKTEYVIADNTASIKVGANNTITYNFVLTADTTVAFNFYATKENPCPEKGNFRLDNVSVIGRP